MHREISNKRSNQRVQLKNPGCKRKNEKQTAEEKQLGSSKLKLGQNFTVAKACSS